MHLFSSTDYKQLLRRIRSELQTNRLTTSAHSWFFRLISSEASETIRAVRTSMKAKLLFAMLLLSVTVVPTFSIPQQKAESASKVLSLENKWNEAYKQGDVTAMNSLLADDFIITVEDGTTFSKSGYVAHCANPDNRVLISEMSDLKVRMHGNTAIVTGAYHEKGTSKGKPYEFHDRLTDVWMLNDGRWQVVASHYAIPAK